ncbi:MAG: dihydrodipicolinate synthase family protein [Rhizobiales bacterium]|nr:dihydrodipicolinate synthase family protein [Hyphomicrobiales bacterium]MBN9011061.1 dihydrodipicolinate synthase family protein [Hyphomicrobiales bacterium]
MQISGIIPVMLTPFQDDGSVDYASLERLTEWYIAHGADALFAVCQSSEMQYLSLAERVEMARFVVRIARGRVPVVASGHISTGIDDQKAELAAVAETGVDGVVLVTNRLDPEAKGTEVFRASLKALLAALPPDLPLGLYECPAPYRRLLSDDEFKACIDSGRFAMLKDVSCDLATVKRRVALAKGSGFAVINANAAIARDAMRAGSRGFCGVSTNIHPDLYAWLYRTADTPLAEELTQFLVMAALFEAFGYPAIAKVYQQRLGTIATIRCRTITYDVREKFWALDQIVDALAKGTDLHRARIAAQAAAAA